MRTLYLDCFAGISGNMLLGALLDLGVPEEEFRNMIRQLPIENYELKINRIKKLGIDAYYVDVKLGHHDHVTTHHHHEHRHLQDIIDLINQAPLHSTVKTNSIKVFQNLAQAEAKVHGTTVEHIHFHEVGAEDAIIDIVGVAFALHYLDIKTIHVSKLQVGTGFVTCAHGLMPIPAPATAELLVGIPYYAGDIPKELVTPTGAAIISTLASSYGNMPELFVSQAIGYGAGTYDLQIPNVLRAYLGHIDIIDKQPEEISIIETNIDDMNPQNFAYVMEKLLVAGALDVWLTPIIMKKSRSGTILSVLSACSTIDSIRDILFTETTTIGTRQYAVARTVAARYLLCTATPWGEVAVKVSSYKGKPSTITPEYEDCRKIAAENHIPLKIVQEYARQIAYEQIKESID